VLLVKTIPALLEKSDLLEFTFGSEPIIKLIAWLAVTLKIDFIGATPVSNMRCRVAEIDEQIPWRA
jgi:hypothetical protein